MKRVAQVLRRIQAWWLCRTVRIRDDAAARAWLLKNVIGPAEEEEKAYHPASALRMTFRELLVAYLSLYRRPLPENGNALLLARLWSFQAERDREDALVVVRLAVTYRDAAWVGAAGVADAGLEPDGLLAPAVEKFARVEGIAGAVEWLARVDARERLGLRPVPVPPEMTAASGAPLRT